MWRACLALPLVLAGCLGPISDSGPAGADTDAVPADADDAPATSQAAAWKGTQPYLPLPEAWPELANQWARTSDPAPGSPVDGEGDFLVAWSRSWTRVTNTTGACGRSFVPPVEFDVEAKRIRTTWGAEDFPLGNVSLLLAHSSHEEASSCAGLGYRFLGTDGRWFQSAGWGRDDAGRVVPLFSAATVPFRLSVSGDALQLDGLALEPGETAARAIDRQHVWADGVHDETGGEVVAHLGLWSLGRVEHGVCVASGDWPCPDSPTDSQT